MNTNTRKERTAKEHTKKTVSDIKEKITHSKCGI